MNREFDPTLTRGNEVAPPIFSSIRQGGRFRREQSAAFLFFYFIATYLESTADVQSENCTPLMQRLRKKIEKKENGSQGRGGSGGYMHINVT